uniref:Uncharacterized protein n=1 Tax=Setaria viridis TaxID=4556 RepID=A0A4U6VIT2_SETVI|nr:hypothetical protein SEVIR_3G296050v2 [Setaria viridis]
MPTPTYPFYPCPKISPRSAARPGPAGVVPASSDGAPPASPYPGSTSGPVTAPVPCRPPPAGRPFEPSPYRRRPVLPGPPPYRHRRPQAARHRTVPPAPLGPDPYPPPGYKRAIPPGSHRHTPPPSSPPPPAHRRPSRRPRTAA